MSVDSSMLELQEGGHLVGLVVRVLRTHIPVLHGAHKLVQWKERQQTM